MHHFIASAAVLSACLAPTLAAPVAENQATDADILNYALTLEHLEDTFYREGLAQFSEEDFANAGYDTAFYENLKEIGKDECDHVDFLTTALKGAGATPVQACDYTFGYTDVPSFLATASILEGVGVSAYLGAAALILEKAYLTAAGSILTVEARHSSYLRGKLGSSPFPQAFDAPLTLNEVFSLAKGFITACPEGNPALPVKAFPGLKVAEGGETAAAGSSVTLETDAETDDVSAFAAFIAVTGPVFVEATPVDGGFSVEIPDGFAGQTYVVLTNSDQAVSDDTTLAGPAIIEIS